MLKPSTDFMLFLFNFAPANHGIVAVRQAYAYVQGDYLRPPCCLVILLDLCTKQALITFPVVKCHVRDIYWNKQWQLMTLSTGGVKIK
jgi:hypothetical protein